MKSKKKSKIKIPIIDRDIKRNIGSKQVSNVTDPIDYDLYTPCWSFKRMQYENEWFFIPDEFLETNQNCISTACILSKLANFETMTWGEIKKIRRGNGKSNNHFIEDLDNLCKKARERLRELNIQDNFFSLHLDNMKRIYGILANRIFEILWYDNKHEIYPIDK